MVLKLCMTLLWGEVLSVVHHLQGDGVWLLVLLLSRGEIAYFVVIFSLFFFSVNRASAICELHLSSN
jgi:hypothetical protein